jgi:preprotein translocase subunit YajC
MEAITTIISLVLLLGLVLSPLIIIKRQNKRNSKYKFIPYLTMGLAITAFLTLAYAWWSATSDEMLLTHYSYDSNGMNEVEIYGKVASENMVRVKTLETSMMGIGWPLKAIMMYIVCILYLLIVYFVNNSMQSSKRRTTPNTSLLT